MNAIVAPLLPQPSAPIHLDWPDGEFRYWPSFWPVAQADDLLVRLREEIPWRNHPVRLFGREIPTPRLSCWLGDGGADYRYSGVRHQATAWTPAVATIRADLARRLGIASNSVLGNLYRDGRDRMGWHSDDEPELGRQPVIVSASFGAVRRFALRHRRLPLRQSLWLAHGSVLVMAGDSQRGWQHALPATRADCGPRINLTFRIVQQGRA